VHRRCERRVVLSEETWQRLLGWAARVRANPRFELEERELRLEAAARIKDVLDAAAREEPIVERIEALHAFLRPRLPELLAPAQLAQLLRWAREDPAALTGAVRLFAGPEADAADAVARFAEAFPRYRSGLAGVGLQLASLFAFGTAPGRIPIVRLPVYLRLEERFGEQAPDGSVAERYRHHLAFAGRMHDAFVRAGIDVADMIDTEALMLICWQDAQFWADDDDGRRPRPHPPDHYLAACAIYRDEAHYLAEWIEFHRLTGFERFYLYDNLSSDHHREVLAPYVEEGIAVVHEWPVVPGQMPAYDHCLETYGDEARWIGFFDVDEFVFSPTYLPVSEVLRDYERWPGVCVNLPRFGTSGHREPPDGLVIENYLTRLRVRADLTVKSVVDPAAVEGALNAHQFRYRRRTAVNENGYPVHGTLTKSASYERLRANHYYSKSEEELRAKHERVTADYSALRKPLPDDEALTRWEDEVGVRDTTILHYLEPLREALAKRAPAP
jgi:Glycosyltransferase family 92